MIFNGIEKEYIVTLAGRRRSAWAPVSRTLVTVPGMAGAHLSHTDIQARVITVPILVKAKNISDLQKIKEDMAEWLIHDEPKELIFKDEPDRVYYALVDGELELDEIFSTGQGEITFICPDPYKYGEEITVEFPSDALIIENPGTAEADPIFELTAREPSTFAMVSNGEEYMMVGIPIDADTEPFVREEISLHDTLSSTTGWTSGTQVDDGAITGTMVSDGSNFIASDFGSPPTGTKWYGPALRTSLPEPLQDFRAEILLRHFNSTKGVGRVALYLLNVNSEIIGRIHLVDAWQTINRNRVSSYVQSGDGSHRKQLHHIDETTAEATGELWNNFDGMLRMERVGNRWTAYVAKIREDGTHHARETKRYTDTAGYYTDEVAQIQLHIGIFGGYEPSDMAIKDLKVWKINDPDDHQVPYIVDQGDSIIFDHATRDCYINGEPAPPDFGADFFRLAPGENTLTVFPDDTFNSSIKFRPRYR